MKKRIIINIGIIISIILLTQINKVFGIDFLDIENFESPEIINQLDTYEDSDSTVDLSVSYQTFDNTKSKISLRIDYKLETENIWGTYVDIIKDFTIYKNLSLFDYLNIMIKGDGKRDVLEIIFLDSNGKKMRYVNDRIIGNLGWKELKINLSEFIKEKNFNISEVKQLIIRIKSISSDISTGTIYLDNFIGHLKILQAGSQAVSKTSLLTWNVAGQVEYREEPGSASKLWHKYDLLLRGGYRNIGIDSKISIRSLKYDYRNNETEKDFSANEGLTSDTIIPHEVKATKILFFVVNPIPYIDLIEIGNIRINYSPYTLYKVYGYEGINLYFSKIYKLQLNTFYFKEWNDGYTIGGRLLYPEKIWRFTIFSYLIGYTQNKKGLYYENNYEVLGKTIFSENCYTIEERIRYNANKFIRKYIARFIDLRVLYGKYMVKENTDITQLAKNSDGAYIYAGYYSSPYNHFAEIGKAELRFKYIIIPSSSLNFYYYKIGSFSFVRPGGNSDNIFTPTFMQEGISDDYQGYEAELISKYFNTFILSGSYGKYQRVESSEYWNKYSFGIGRSISLINISLKATYKKYKDRDIDGTKYDIDDKYFSFKAKARIGRKVIINSSIKARVDKYYRDNEFRWEERGMMFSNLIRYKFNNKAHLELEIVRTLPDNYFPAVTFDNVTRLIFTFKF